MSTLGNSLKTVRISRGYNQKQLAERTGISRSYISKLEQDNGDPTLSILTRICDALDIPTTMLMLLTERHNPKLAPFVPMVLTDIWG